MVVRRLLAKLWIAWMMAAPGLGRLGAEVVDSTGHVVLLGQVVAQVELLVVAQVELLGHVVDCTVVGTWVGCTVVGAVVVVVLKVSLQYIRFNLALSFSLMRKRWPIVCPCRGRRGMMVSLPLMLNAVGP